MNVGILGLGLIGGSLARAYTKAGHSVYTCDIDENMQVELTEEIEFKVGEVVTCSFDESHSYLYTAKIFQVHRHRPRTPFSVVLNLPLIFPFLIKRFEKHFNAIYLREEYNSSFC